MYKTFGILFGPGKAGAFRKRSATLLEELSRNCPDLIPPLESLVALHVQACERIAALDKQVRRLARSHDVCRRFMTVPGVGPVTALSVWAGIDKAERFAKSSSVGAYFGLTPRRYASGEIDRIGRISKCGDRQIRTHLFEAANVLLTRTQRWSALKAWGMRIARRSSLKKAKVAVARKLAVILHRMWCDGTDFQWSGHQEAHA